ncbi:MAG: hypothetical protein MSR67_08215 [Oscillospiraceae bacterium]|nr:hypothetical protein [Oscillospiraceae bacterium]
MFENISVGFIKTQGDFMVTWLYFLTFAASIIMMASFLLRNSKIDTGYVLFGLTIVTTAMGRWFIAASDSLG